MSRQPVPADVAANVLIKCRRRCCLCLFWDGNGNQQDGQLAHIDHDSSNSTEANLAYLCFKHHNQYDARQLQGKNITQEELRHAKCVIENEFPAVTDPIVSARLELDRDYTSFTDDDEREFLESIRNLLQTGSNVQIVQRRRGSVIIDVALPAGDAKHLLHLIEIGKLDRFAVVSAKLDRVFDYPPAIYRDAQVGDQPENVPTDASEETVDKQYRCFVIAPFTDRFNTLYAKHIRSICQDLRVQCIRADEFVKPGAIIPAIWESIRDADFIIADLTDRNANVYFELGVATALQKPVVLLTQEVESIPFDLRHHRAITYKDTPKGRGELTYRLSEVLAHLMSEE